MARDRIPFVDLYGNDTTIVLEDGATGVDLGGPTEAQTVVLHTGFYDLLALRRAADWSFGNRFSHGYGNDYGGHYGR